MLVRRASCMADGRLFYTIEDKPLSRIFTVDVVHLDVLCDLATVRGATLNACTLLSSITVFMDSIHTASISPSSTTHLYV